MQSFSRREGAFPVSPEVPSGEKVCSEGQFLPPPPTQPFPLLGLTTVLPLDGLQGRVRRQWPKVPSVEVQESLCPWCED